MPPNRALNTCGNGLITQIIFKTELINRIKLIEDQRKKHQKFMKFVERNFPYPQRETFESEIHIFIGPLKG